ncbi:enoyl-[acyl-carrier-protein] reductase FabK [Enterococcus nangangensis]|uniref:enoyl-[acyl-carrier-protein] reductase FabK n=1 Tax=Enterococcus nangangensis TaxID=2559926 RepID=UPI0010F4E16D|nr:enoyl-[acyl-carrier-protein] reductase FabK [Enterococcus nangangensis]
METKVTRLLGIEKPLFQGGMAWVAEATLASAVSNAGGLGIIGAGNAPRDVVAQNISRVRKLTSKPFGVNVMLLSPFAPDIIDLVIEEKVPVVTTGAGNPAPYMERLKAAGIKVIPVVPSVALAKRMEKIGADAVIAEGMEAGGHIGKLTTMAMVPQIADAVTIPVIAAGGIADGRGFAAALMLGASAVQVGTAFLVAEECQVHENYKAKVLKARDIDTVITCQFFGHPVRGLKNKLTTEYIQQEKDELRKESPDADALENLGVGALRRAVQDGDLATGAFMSGQIAGLVKEKASCQEIIASIVDQGVALLQGGFSA